MYTQLHILIHVHVNRGVIQTLNETTTKSQLAPSVAKGLCFVSANLLSCLKKVNYRACHILGGACTNTTTTPNNKLHACIIVYTLIIVCQNTYNQ